MGSHWIRPPRPLPAKAPGLQGKTQASHLVALQKGSHRTKKAAEGVCLPEHRLTGLESLPAPQGEPAAAALEGPQGREQLLPSRWVFSEDQQIAHPQGIRGKGGGAAPGGIRRECKERSRLRMGGPELPPHLVLGAPSISGDFRTEPFEPEGGDGSIGGGGKALQQAGRSHKLLHALGSGSAPAAQENGGQPQQHHHGGEGEGQWKGTP